MAAAVCDEGFERTNLAVEQSILGSELMYQGRMIGDSVFFSLSHFFLVFTTLWLSEYIRP